VELWKEHYKYTIEYKCREEILLYCTGWTTKKKPAFRFARVLVILSLALVRILRGVFEQSVNSRAVTLLRYTRFNLVILMAAVFSGDTWKVRYTNQIRTRHRNWRTTSATQLQPSKLLLHPVYSYLNMIRRAQLCIDAGGNHFHRPLWWYILSAFGYCINFCIYAMLRTRANFSLPILYNCDVLFQGSISSLMMATCVYPKHVAVFTCMIIAVYTRLWSIFFSLHTYKSKFCLRPQFFKHRPCHELEV